MWSIFKPFSRIFSSGTSTQCNSHCKEGDSAHSCPERTQRMAVDSTAFSEGIVTPDGMGVLVSVGGEKQVRGNWFDCEPVLRYEPLESELLFYPKCSHVGPRKFKIHGWSEAFGREVPDKYIGPKGKEGKRIVTNIECPACYAEIVKKSTIRCCFCGGEIMPDDGVALYGKGSTGIHESATILEDGESVIGCLRWDCCPSGGFFGGYWTEKGFKAADFDKM